MASVAALLWGEMQYCRWALNECGVEGIVTVMLDKTMPDINSLIEIPLHFLKMFPFVLWVREKKVLIPRT